MQPSRSNASIEENQGESIKTSRLKNDKKSFHRKNKTIDLTDKSKNKKMKEKEQQQINFPFISQRREESAGAKKLPDELKITKAN